jgi:site-specific DNA recombinase
VAEKLVEEHYQHAVLLPQDFREGLRREVVKAAEEHSELPAEMRENLKIQLKALHRRESYFLDLAADEGWPRDLLRTKLDEIRDEQRKIQNTIDQGDRQLAIGRQIFELALDLLEQPKDLYRRSDGATRAMLNSAFFTRLYIDGERITGQDRAEPLGAIHELYRVGEDSTNSLKHALSLVSGSSKGSMVDPRGFEPLTF